MTAHGSPIQRIYTLGPEGTFSDQAARRVQRHLATLGHAGTTIVCTRTIPEVPQHAMVDAASVGVVPIENSYVGTVMVTLEGLHQHDLVVEWELSLRIRFRLLANAPIPEVRRIFAHPAAYEQCGFFLAERLPNVAATFTNSNTDSGDRLRQAAADEPSAAIVPIDYGDDLPELVRATDVQNDPQNTTRFLVVRRRSESAPPDFSRKKASLIVDPDVDRPGLLHDILTVFKRHDVNLCRIESRPARTRPWAYVFHMDIHPNSRGKEVLAELEAEGWKVRLLGTFDAVPED
jgi:prephenate dehydratase